MRDEVEEELYEEECDLVVFDRHYNEEEVPQGFSAVTYKIDVSPKSKLSWNILSEQVPHIFDLDFGLFGPSWQGFSHQGYFQTCQFALSHLLPALTDAAGCIVARLTLPFSQNVPWTTAIEENFEAWKKMRVLHDKELFCRDLIVEYLTLLTASIPNNKLRYLVLDATAIQDPLSYYQLTQKDAYGSFSLAIQNGKNCPIRRTLQVEPPANPNIAFLLRSYTNATRELADAFNVHVAQNIPFKVIVEDFLTSEWDGIDELIIASSPYSQTTQRAIDGFGASGGIVKKSA